MDSDSDVESFNIFSTPPDILESANIATFEMLPKKSREVYENCYRPEFPNFFRAMP